MTWLHKYNRRFVEWYYAKQVYAFLEGFFLGATLYRWQFLLGFTVLFLYGYVLNKTQNEIDAE